MQIKTLLLLTSLAVTLSPAAAQTAARAATPRERPVSNQFWWPDLLDLRPLRQNAVESDPVGANFDYAAAFNSLDLKAVKKDIEAVLATSQP